jgi:hemerythrin-like domain-containing protein
LQKLSFWQVLHQSGVVAFKSHKSTEIKMARSSRKTTSPEPVEMLMEDHRKVQKAFKQFEKMKDQDDQESKRDLVEHTCAELKVHTQLEEELFYPAAREGLEDGELVAEALIEHGSAKQLIEQLESIDVGDETYDATFTVLGEYVNHHIEEEQGEMFPKLKKADLDWDSLAAEMRQRKRQLQEEMGLTSVEQGAESEEDETAASGRRPREEAPRSRRSAARK